MAVVALTGNAENSKAISDAYKQFIDATFPFATKTKAQSDQQLVDMMKKEAAKGVIKFSPIQTPNPLMKTAAKLRLPDEFRQKLQERAKQERDNQRQPQQRARRR